METGILPLEFAGKIQCIGNGVLKGNIAFGLYKEKEQQAVMWNAEVVPIALKKEFQEIYMKYVNFVV